MTNPNLSQRERSQYNPLNLGKFDRTSLRFLTSTLGMRSQIIQGGIGNNTYNNWFQVTLEKAGWIILIKGGTVLSTSNTTRQNLYQDINSRVMLAVYDQNHNPIQGRIIQQEPDAYRGNVAGAQSDLYNNFDSNRFDKGDEMFYELEPGNYLICVSATRNEEFNYGVGLVIDINDDREQFILTEDTVEIKHTRSDYNIVDFLGDLGGIQYMLATLIGFFFFALSEFNLFIEIFDKLFHLKDSENELLFDVKTK